MATKYLVVEIRNEESLGKILSAISAHTDRLALVDSVPGVFELATSSNKKSHDVSRPAKRKREELPTNTPLLTGSDSFDMGLTDELKSILGNSLMNDYFSADANESNMLDEEVLHAFRKRPREDESTPLTIRRKATESNLVCGLCKSKMTLRASYGRTRLREHVMRHLNKETCKCGHCDFTGVLREHIRRHYSLKHKGVTPVVVETDLSEDYNEQFESLWRVCFPEIDLIQPRMTSQRARYYVKAGKKKMENQVDDNVEDDADNNKPSQASSDVTPNNTQNIPGILTDDLFFSPNSTIGENFFNKNIPGTSVNL